MGSVFTTFRVMFYLLTPSETYYERLEDVPDYVVRVNYIVIVEKKTKTNNFNLKIRLGYSTISGLTTFGISRCMASRKNIATF